jgi:hypothetical protein
MTGKNAVSLTLPIANCVLCRWPMEGTVNILQVHIGTAVYRACAGECPPRSINRQSSHARSEYAERRYRAERARVRRESQNIAAARGENGGSLTSAERRQLERCLIPGNQSVKIAPSSAAGLSAPQVVERVRELLRCETPGLDTSCSDTSRDGPFDQ